MSWERAHLIVKEGGVVALPTETVYGLFGLPREDVVEKIYSIKGRDKTKPLGIMLGRKEDVFKIIKVPPWAHPLIEELLPGPLTIIGESTGKLPVVLTQDNTVGIRVPDQNELLEFLKNFPFGLIQTSANLSGYPDCLTHEEVENQLKEKVDYILPGRSRGSRPSTVVSVTGEYPLLLRKGPISILTIEKLTNKEVKLAPGMTLNILFVCTGNTCRSPMAEFILRKMIPKEKKHLFAIRSSGTNTWDGLEINPLTHQVLLDLSIDAKHHKTKSLTKDDIEWADLVYAMDNTHLEFIKTLGGEEKSKLFGEKYDQEIPDPVGKTVKFYEMVRDRIKFILEDHILPYILNKVT